MERELLTRNVLVAPCGRATRFRDESDLDSCVRKEDPDVIVNCLGYSGPDEGQLALVHSRFPRLLAGWAAEHGRLFVHISTNAVFPSDDERRWLAADAPRPETPYAQAKVEGEDPKAWVIRTSFIGKSPRGTGLFDDLLAGRPYQDRLWNGVTTLTLAQRIAELAIEHAKSPVSGIEHVHSPEAVSVSDIACWLGSFSQAAGRRKSALLGGGRPLPPLKEQLQAYLRHGMTSR